MRSFLASGSLPECLINSFLRMSRGRGGRHWRVGGWADGRGSTFDTRTNEEAAAATTTNAVVSGHQGHADRSIGDTKAGLIR